MLYTYFICEYSHNFTTELMKAHLLFCIVPIFVNSLLPLSNSTCSHPVNVSLLPLLPYAGGLYIKAQIGANLMAWGQDCKVGAAIVFFRILWWPHIVMNEQHFGHFSHGTNSTKWRQAFIFISAPLCQRSMSSHKETVAINFLADDTLLTFFFLGCVAPFHRLLHGVCLKIVVPGVISFDILWQKGLTFCATFVQKTSGEYFPCLCVWTCQHSWHPKSTDLEQPSTSAITITLPLPVCKVE